MRTRTARITGHLTKDNRIAEIIPDEDRSLYSLERYKFLLDAPFAISNKCCDIFKKKPIRDYEKRTGRKAIVGTMADESSLRKESWLKFGCNIFDSNGQHAQSRPLSFWTEQDVLNYIVDNDLQICSVYGNIVIDYDKERVPDGSFHLSDYMDLGVQRPLRTTLCDRTGCELCGFGAHCERVKEGRFLRLKREHPGMYNLLDVVENNGVTYRQAIEWLNAHSPKINIKL